MKLHIFDNFLTSISVVGEVVSSLKWLPLRPMINFWNNRKKVSIIDNGIYNIGKYLGEIKLLSNISNGYSSPFLHRVIVETSRKDKFNLTDISLEDINYEEYHYSEILYDGGFFNENQYFTIVGINNGNEVGHSDKISIKFQPLKIGQADGTYSLTIDVINHENEIGPGNIQSIYSKKITDEDSILHFFSKNFDQYDRLKIIVQFENNSCSPLTSIIAYDPENHSFTVNGRGFLGPIEKYPLMNLETRPTILKRPITVQLSKGSNQIDFLVATQEACILSYNLAFWSGKKKFNTNFKSEITVKVPHYTQEENTIYGRIYDFLAFQVKKNIKIHEFKYNVDYLSSLKKQAKKSDNNNLYYVLNFIYDYKELVAKFSDTKL
ncbi:hypothetical protein ACFSN5_05915 [Streptococcus tangpeifui]|uniref:hypothetical protein n=1 Tax=Streptococcus tangpeifui TaxID=2709400 RepID=UPI0013EC7A24|nr:hypothetical protein [Streptococcus sp. ZJ1593]